MHPQPARISILPGILVNQIAAGEVIERPASVVKELVENSIDAGATRIDIEIEAGGTRAIIIRDNGSGIHPDDLELAVMRHTTSKLRTREDLESIRTLGFRGEALSSIASVSLLSITSRTLDGAHARRLTINPAEGSSELAPAAHPAGTTVEVMNLFYNVPARRKFLRSERTEFLHILELVKYLVMSRPDIHIQLRHNGKLLLNCPAVESDFGVRLQSVLGSSFQVNARPVEANSDAMHLYGWMGSPAAARSQSDQQYFYLNNRIIRDRRITHAVRMAADQYIPVARYPAYVLYLNMDPALVDVNVHPTKQEVRFRYPRDVHDFIFAALRDETIQSASPAQSVRQSFISSGEGITGLQEATAVYQTVSPDPELNNPDTHPFGMPVAVLKSGHIAAIHADTLRIIDFNRLRMVFLYRRLQENVVAQSVTARPLLVPVIFSVQAADVEILSESFEVLGSLGLQVELSGPRSITIRTLPALLPELELGPLLADIPGCLRERPAQPDAQIVRLIHLFIRHAGLLSADKYSLSQIAGQLCRFTGNGFQPDDPEHAGLWRTLSAAELHALLNHDN